MQAQSLPRTVREARIVRAADGFPLAVRVHEPRQGAAATVVIHPALAVPQTFYGRLAEWLASRGVRAVTFDYRGAGASRYGHHLPEATLSHWARLDAPAVFRHVRARHGGRTVILAHSIGGQFLGFADDYREADAAIVVAASLSHWRLYRGRERWNLALWGATVPAVSHLAGRFPAWMGLGMDLPAGVGAEWSRWIRDREWFLGSHPDTRARLASFDRPVRFYSFTDDTVAPPEAVRAFVGTLRAAPVDHRHLSPRDLGVRHVGHFGFFRPAMETPLWHDVLEVARGTAAARAA
jgi:predicted alpha/beta hydrolase